MLKSIPRRLRERHRRHSRGQSLVEFALILPLLLALTLTALDFGRVYLGWINLQNMTRIAANFAANNPDAWTGGGNTKAQTQYRNQILADATATNCQLPTSGGKEVVPAPTFTDANGDGKSTQLGDTARVDLSCSFGVITPFVASVVGSTVTVSSTSVFPVKAGMTAITPVTGATAIPQAAFSGNGTLAPSSISGAVPFTVIFRDTSGGGPTAWFWEFADDGSTSTDQDVEHTFLNTGTYIVSLTVTNVNGSTTQTMGVTVVDPGDVDFIANKTGGPAPLAVTFSDVSDPVGTDQAWTFGAGEGTGTGPTPSHTYTTPGSYDVSLTVTVDGAPVTVTKSVYINVAVPTCTVPHLDERRRNDAPGIWATFGFTGAVTDGVGAPSGNYTIFTQSVTAGSIVPCDTNVVVNAK